MTTGAGATIHSLRSGTLPPRSRSGSDLAAAHAHIHSPYFN